MSLVKRRGWTIVAGLLLAGVTVMIAAPSPIDPVAWQPGDNPGLTGRFAGPRGFDGQPERQADGVGLGPEDVTKGPDGLFYTGLQDGRVVHFRVGEAPTTVVNTGGRPLGLEFDAQGNLIIADAFKGLLSLSPQGTLRVLTDSAEGARLLFTDDLDIAADGTIWFSDASQRFDQHHWILDFWEGRATGRLLSYRPQAGTGTGETRVHLRGLQFANGIALGPDDQFVLINETIPGRIVRYWLQGPKAGTSEIFIDGLPGHPDNLSSNGRGTFWVALPAPRQAALERLAGWPTLRKMIFRLPESWIRIQPEPLAWVLGIDVNGQVIHNLQDRSGIYTNITSVNEIDGDLWFGSIYMKSVGRAIVPQRVP